MREKITGATKQKVERKLTERTSGCRFENSPMKRRSKKNNQPED